MQNYLLPENLANEILNYLASRPYSEVYKLIAAIQALQPDQSVPSAEGAAFAAAARAKLEAEKLDGGQLGTTTTQ